MIVLPSTFAPGNKRYQLVRQLGYGGMGVVYLVFDKRREQNIALKLLHDPAQRSQERFKREFRELANIQHPNIIQIYELGTSPDGQLFYTMEYIDGVELDAYLQRVELGPRFLSIFAGVAEALYFLHSANKVHCDIKPSNILVLKDDTPKLLDFGIIREVEGASGKDIQLGTPRYLAPERSRGELSTASDMYSLGCVLYEALTKRPLFIGSAGELLQQHQSTTPARPSEVVSCPAALGDLCMELLQKEPSRRPSAGEVLERLHKDLGAAAPKKLHPTKTASIKFIGREKELAVLVGARDKLGAEPLLALIEGPLGVGKSALAFEFSCRCQEQGYKIWRGNCDPRESIPYNALDKIVGQLAPLLDEVLSSDEIEGLASLLRIFPVLRASRVAKGLAIPSSGDPWTERRLAIGALFRLLSLFSKTRPPILFIEDLQWADAESLEILRWLPLATDWPPVMVVGTCREAGLAEDVRGPRVLRCSLAPLPKEELLGLLTSKSPSATAELLSQIWDAANGDLFYALSAARSHEAPASLAAMFKAQLEKVSKTAQGLLRVLSVGEFGFADLLELSGVRSGEMSQSLDELLRLGLLQEVGEQFKISSEAFVRFLYEGLSVEEREGLHRKIATRIEATQGAARAVYHWKSAGAKEEMRRAAIVAAHDAERALAFAHAADFYAIAQEQRGDWELSLSQANALRRAGRYRRAALLFEQAPKEAPAEATQQSKMLAITSHLAAGDFAAGLQGLRSFLEQHQEVLPSSLLRQLTSIGWGSFWLAFAWLWYSLPALITKNKTKPSELETLRLEFYESMHFHLLALDPIVATYLGVKHGRLAFSTYNVSHLGRARISHAIQVIGTWGNIRTNGALRHIYSGEALCMAANDKQGLMQALYARGLVNLYEGNWSGVKEAYTRGNTLARQDNLFGEPALMELQNFYFASLYLSGSFATLLREASIHLAETKERGNVVERADPMLLCGLVLLAQGKGDEGREAIQEALSLTPREPMTMLQLRVELMSLELELFEQKAEEGLERLADIIRRWRESGIFAATVEYALFNMQKTKLERLFINLQEATPPELATPPLSTRVIPSSMRDEYYRLEASKALYDKDLPRALKLINRSLSIAERRNNKYGMGIAYAARATIQRRLDLPGTQHDRSRSRAIMSELGIPDCYILFIEGWDNPTESEHADP